MKKLLQFLFVAMTLLAISSFSLHAQVEQDSVTMEPQYANDIYYSFDNGEVASVNRTNWDIAFYTSPWSAGIITNDGTGVELYVYPNGDTAAWQSIDTAGMSSWTPYFNSTDEWEEGAFNRTATGHPDYGWGVYNTITHNLVGDSIYILKYVDDSFKKLWIETKLSSQNTYHYKYANLDGSDEVSEVLNVNDYITKNFVYYSLTNQEVVDREPTADSWDIVFTKYTTILEGGTPYQVTGVLNNLNVPGMRYDVVAPDYNDWTATPMDSVRAPIGHDWKDFDMTIFSYVIQDSVAFFVQNRNQDVYKLVFEVFDYTIGKVVFNKALVSPSFIKKNQVSASFNLVPNPTSNFVTIVTETGNNPDEIIITDLNGRRVYHQDFETSGQTINLEQFESGLYVVLLKSKNIIEAQKLLIK